MSVDICTFRARIGLFDLSKSDGRKPKYKKPRYKTTKWNISIFLLLCCVTSSVSSPPPTSNHHLPGSTHRYRQLTTYTAQLPDIQDNLSSELKNSLSGFQGINHNKICKIINGNRRSIGYQISSWNCGRGLMSSTGSVSDKLLDIKLFIQKNKPSIFGIIESDIHGVKSPSNRKKTYSREDILEQLNIEGYSILLPDTWDTYNQARIIVYGRDDMKIKQRKNPDNIKDLPSITLEVGIGRERKTLVNFYYREWTSGISGDNSIGGQLDRFSRQVDYWKSIGAEDRDIILIGDANYCSQSCTSPDYPADNKAIANIANDFFLEDSMFQLIDQFTRTELRGNTVQKSCIDHITTDVPTKCRDTNVEVGGNSNHLCVTTTKLAKEIVVRPATVKNRSYKYFVKENFLQEIKYTDFAGILEEKDGQSCPYQDFSDK